MPKLIHDTIPYSGGNKADSLRGSYLFSADGSAGKTWTETYLIMTEPPVLIPEDPGPPVVPAHWKLITEEDVLGTAGLPILGQPGRGGWCTSKMATCLKDKATGNNIIEIADNTSPYFNIPYDGLWEVTCQYNADVSTRIKLSTEERDPDNFPGVYWPRRLDFIPAILNWTTETYNEALLQDAQDFDNDTNSMVPIENTAGEPLYPESQRTRVVLAADYFLPRSQFEWINFNIAEEYTNKVNEFQFFGAPKGCVRCASIKYTLTEHVPYYDSMTGHDSNDYLNDDNITQTNKTRLNLALAAMDPAEFLHVKATFKFAFWYVPACITPSIGDPYEALAIDKTMQGWMLRLLNYGNYMRVPKDSDDPANTDTITVHGHQYSKSPTRVNLALDGFKLDPLSPKVFLPFNQYPLADFDAILPIWIRPPESPPLDLITPAPCS